MTATLFIATPVYRGQAYVAETLRSIQAQTFTDFRVLISVDGSDEASADVCRPFLGDPRFEMVVQETQLGWAGNMNWLQERCDAPFWNYWQQDDLCAPTHLERLHALLVRSPGAVCAFSDLQGFGAQSFLAQQPSLTGFALNRFLAHVDDHRWLAYRGVIRSEVLPRVGLLRLTPWDSALEDLVWMAALAREGDLVRLPEPLYFKRFHAESAHARWFAWPLDRQRGMWMETALGLIEVALPLLPRAEDRTRLVVSMVHRVLSPPRPERIAYASTDPDDRVAFARELIREAQSRFDVPPPARIAIPAVSNPVPAPQ